MRLSPVVLVFLAGCRADARIPRDPLGTGSAEAVPVVPVAWHTQRDTTLDIDSPAVWHGPKGEHWMLVTAKAGDVIRVADAATGAFIRDLGSAGRNPGQLERPNGIAVVDDLLFVVERDNARVQVFTLPDFRSVGIYGGGDLVKPYGVTIRRNDDGSWDTWITDSYELVEDSIPPDAALGRRVREYRVTLANDTARGALSRTFGDTAGAGVLRVVESINADVAGNRLLVAEEQEGKSLIKVYTLDGLFTGDTIPSSWFPNQAEGIVLYECGATSGYWITTDQGKVVNTFHVFDRVTLAHVGSFHLQGVLNTDGIALTQKGFGPFLAGAFYAVNDDGDVAAAGWAEIAKALKLRDDCKR